MMGIKRSGLKKVFRIICYFLSIYLVISELLILDKFYIRWWAPYVQIIGLIIGCFLILFLYLNRYGDLRKMAYISSFIPLSKFLIILSTDEIPAQFLIYIILGTIICFIPTAIILSTANMYINDEEFEVSISNVENSKKSCPHCGEEIKLEALVCKYCKYSFIQAEFEYEVRNRKITFDN